MQRQHCYWDILHLTSSDRKPLMWPNAIKISRDIQIQQPGVFFSCCLTAVNTSSLQLVSCWLYFRHLFPMLPDSPVDSKKLFSCFFIHSCYITVLPLLHWGLCPKTTTNILFFCSCISAWELYKNAWPHEPSPCKYDPCHRIPSTVYFYKYWCTETNHFIVSYSGINRF